MDLQSYGVKTQKFEDGTLTASYNQLAFLSNRTLLVAVNQREFTNPVELSIEDSPPALLMLYDLDKGAFVKSTTIKLEKESGSLQPLADAEFIIWNKSGLQICDVSFTCGNSVSVQGDGPVLASPGGTSFVLVGGNKERQRVLSSGSLTETDQYPYDNPAVAPGDGSVLLRHEPSGQLGVKEDGSPEKLLPFAEGSGNIDYSLSSRFISKSAIAISESLQSLVVAKIDGTPLYRIAVYPWYRGTAILTAASGKRFGVRETTYTRWNSLFQFYDSNRSYDIERIRVFEVETGRKVFEVSWDPRPYINRPALPALSPDGHHLALIRRGFLELYEIP